ncbi:MAG: LacI family DNA-binding transcriptional regulator [Maritimibacter sp.]
MIGIRALAKHLNLSIATVSRAINDHPEVNAKTRQRVQQAARELGYVPNQSGRSLRRGETGNVAFMMETGHEITGTGDTFILGVFNGIQTALADHGLDLVAMLCPRHDDAESFLKRMVARGFADGIILSSIKRVDPRVSFLSENKVPFVTLGRTNADMGQSWLDSDFAGMARQSIDRFVARGHRRIALTVPGDTTNLGDIFLDAAGEAMQAHGLELSPELIFRIEPNEEDGYRLAKSILSLADRPTAVFLINPSLTLGLYRGLTEAGIRPGKDIAVIGRDSPQSAFLTPSLTCFREDLDGLGVALGEALLASMPKYARHAPNGAVSKVWPLELVEGESDDLVLAPGISLATRTRSP